MTSSLVGSEMCIRDREKEVDVEMPDSPTIDPQPLQPDQGPAMSSGLPWPVSYTHLTLPTICSV
eukprot:1547569-Prorocentrum_lima.AAC.1